MPRFRIHSDNRRKILVVTIEGCKGICLKNVFGTFYGGIELRVMRRYFMGVDDVNFRLRQIEGVSVCERK